MEILGKIWETWKRFGQFIGDILARIVLTIFYFTIFVPFGLGVRLFSDPLMIKENHGPPFWLSRETGDRSLEEVRRQS
jgi:hypothetical protein